MKPERSSLPRLLARRISSLVAEPRTLRFYLLSRAAKAIMPEYKLGWPQLDWWRDDDFNAYLSRFGEEWGMNAGRRWTMHQLLRMVATIPGDSAECGAWRGASSFLICKANESSMLAREHFIFDSFEGLSEPDSSDGSHWHRGDLSVHEDAVRANLSDCNNVHFMRGWIPTRFSEVAERRFSFVHIDVDLYEPTRDALEFFYPRLSSGGMLLLDDYGFSTCPGATRAVEEYTTRENLQVVGLPYGGGFLIKDRAFGPAPRLS